MIQLNYRDAKPIYEQVKDGIRKLIVAEALLPGEKLPSVRELAAKLTINPNTISRAYRDLEAEGYLRSENGKGTFVAEEIHVTQERTEELLDSFDALVSELFFLSVSGEELIGRVTQIQVRRENDE